jgi:hypothetical protein
MQMKPRAIINRINSISPARRFVIAVIFLLAVFCIVVAGMHDNKETGNTISTKTDASKEAPQIQSPAAANPNEPSDLNENPALDTTSNSSEPDNNTPQTQAVPAKQSAPSKSIVKSNPPTTEPAFLIQSLRVFNVPYYSCDVYGQWLYFPGAFVTVSSHSGGTLNWQVEKMTAGNVSVVSSGSNNVEQNQLVYNLTDTYGLFKGRGGANDMLRLHMTAPNDYATQWYTPKSGESCSSY